jgi:hypothetical protein
LGSVDLRLEEIYDEFGREEDGAGRAEVVECRLPEEDEKVLSGRPLLLLHRDMPSPSVEDVLSPPGALELSSTNVGCGA